jgi:hypothetical protein
MTRPICATLAISFIRYSLTRSTLFMIAPETFNHIENIKKRAGHLWRFL